MARAQRDFFDKARSAAAAGLILSGIWAIAGVLLDWVSITPPRVLPEAEASKTEPFAGIDVVPDGWLLLAIGIALLFLGPLLALKRSAGYAWTTFLLSMIVGGIAVARLREIGDITSGLSEQMQIVGDAEPAAGIYLIAGAGVLGLIASVAGIAATPSDRLDDS